MSGAALASFEAAEQPSAARRILAASSALGMATAIERGLGFLSNFLAARIGGAGVFGAYSLALTTANNIASYAGGGIGSTATRFSGEHGRATPAYGTLVRSLALVSAASAVLATVLLTLGAGPLARVLLHNPQLTTLLRWAALSAGAMVLLECCRGLFIGQREFPSLLLLSVLGGLGLVIGVPLCARVSPTAMVMAQAGALLFAVGVCGFLTLRRLQRGISSARTGAGAAQGVGQMVRQIWHFGVVQLAGTIGLNAAGWWVASLVARADTSLVEMGLFAAANQFRNMAAMAPGLLTQSSYGMLAERSDDGAPVHEQVLSLCSFGAGISSVAIAGSLILVLPWALPLTYGAGFRLGVLPASLAMATAIVHMSSAPAAARLTIRSLRASGFINGLWAVLVAGLATKFVSEGGAVAALTIYLAVHVLSGVLVLAALVRRERLPDGLIAMTAVLFATAAGLAALAWWRSKGGHQGDAAIAGLVCVSLAIQLALAQHYRWIPDRWIPDRWIPVAFVCGGQHDEAFQMRVLAYVHLRNIVGSTGAGRVARQMTESLAGLRGVDLRVLADAADHRRVIGQAGRPWTGYRYHFFESDTSRQQARWFFLRSPSAEHYWPQTEIAYCTAESYVPVQKARLAVTLHDAAYFESGAHRGDLSFWKQRLKWKLLYGALDRNADLFHTVSNYSAERLAHFFPSIRGRLRVVHNAVTSRFFQPVSTEGERSLASAGLEGQRFVLLPGGLHHRKNADLVLEAWPRLEALQPGLRLVVVNHSDPAYAARAQQQKGIQLAGFVSEEMLASLYQSARVVWFPSRYEGFGMPVLEAMASGAPVVASNSSAIPEVAGDAAVLVGAKDVDGHIAAIEALLNDSAERAAWIGRGRERAKDFTWLRSAEKLHSEFRSLLQ